MFKYNIITVPVFLVIKTERENSRNDEITTLRVISEIDGFILGEVFDKYLLSKELYHNYDVVKIRDIYFYKSCFIKTEDWRDIQLDRLLNKGNQETQGTQGTTGPQGFQGNQGTQGVTVSQGTQGNQDKKF